MSVKRRVFPETFKREVVERVATSGLSAGRVTAELGLHETVLRRWMVQLGAARRSITQAPPPSPSDLWPPRMPVFAVRTIGSGWNAIS